MTIPEALEKYPIQLSAQLIRVWAQSERGCPFCYVIRSGNRKNLLRQRSSASGIYRGEKQ